MATANLFCDLDMNGNSILNSSGGAVSSVFGRTGAVVAASNDYSEAQLSFTDIVTNNVGTTKHGFAPKAPNDATKFLDGTAAYDTVKDSDLSTSDITTNDVSTTKHGFAPKAPNDATKFLNGVGAYAVPAGSGGGGTQLDYVERTTSFTVTATSDATASAVITGNAVTYDGATRVLIVVYFPASDCTASQNVLLNLYDGSTDLGRLVNYGPNAGTGAAANSLNGSRFLTPSAAAHTYSIRAWKTGGTANVYGGAGGAATYLPAYYRIVTV